MNQTFNITTSNAGKTGTTIGLPGMLHNQDLRSIVENDDKEGTASLESRANR